MGMNEQLPAPLVPPEVDLRDFGYMPLDALRLRDSELAIEASPEVFRASVLLWCASWHQVPAGSLPAKDKTLAEYSRAGARWPRIRSEVLSKWVKCSDGRLYHPVVAEKAREAQAAKDAQRARTKAATNARETKRREQQIPRDDKRDAARNESRDEPRNVNRDEQRDVQRNVVQGKGREGKRREEIQNSERAALPPPLARDPDATPGKPPEQHPEANGHQPTPAGRVCRAMKQAGLSSVNPGDPRLLALLEQGATDAEFSGIAAEAVEKRKGFAWVLTVLQNRRAEAAEIDLAPPPGVDPNAWRNSRDGVINRGANLGLPAFDEVAAHVGSGPSWNAYRSSVFEADEHQRSGAAA